MPATSQTPSILPRPLLGEWGSGIFELTNDTVIVVDQESSETGHYLAGLPDFPAIVVATGTVPADKHIMLTLDSARVDLGDEGYVLSIAPDAVCIEALRPAGLFYACQTLRQLLQSHPESCPLLPCGSVVDHPRFPWRGLMLDVARHFMTVEFLKRYIDLLALYKMNRLHLHLTDGQAWTLDIPGYPRLTERRDPPAPGAPARGSYSRQDIEELVAHAASRHVTLVPEIEFPSHADAPLEAYPQWRCINHRDDEPREFCAGREEVFTAIRDILTEVAALFPGPYLHIGGDEYYGLAWERCPDCQRRMVEEHLADEDSEELRRLFHQPQGSPRKYLLYRYLMRRVARIVVEAGKTPVLWDDLAWRGNFPEKSVILQWHYRGLQDWVHQANTPENPAAAAVEAGHAAVTAPASHLYFDYFDGGKLLPRLYAFEPVPDEVTAEQAAMILGPHACMWERAQEEVDTMVFPRLLALAEVGWTDRSLRAWDDFSPRLQRELPRLQALGVRAAPLGDLVDRLQVRWSIPPSFKWMREWWLNEVVTGEGSYRLALTVDLPEMTSAISRVYLVIDGHESLIDEMETLEGDNLIWRFRVDEYSPATLYSIRVYFHWEESAECHGDAVIEKIEA